MATPQSGQRADGGLDRRLRKTEDDIRQLRERFARPQKIPTATSGGISGATRCDAYDYEEPSGIEFYGIDWHFTDLYGSTGPTVTTGANARSVYVADAGWYQASLNFNVSWTSVPAQLSVRIYFDGEDEDYPTMWKPILAQDEAPSPYDQVRAVFHSPIVYLEAGARFMPSIGWKSGPTVGAFHHFTLDVVKFG